MNPQFSTVEWFLMFPLWLVWFVTGQPNATGLAVLLAFLTLIGLWCAVIIRWKRDVRRSKLVVLFLVAIIGFPLINFFIMVKEFGVFPKLPLVSQFVVVVVVQSYLSLSVLTHCEAFWQHRGRAAYVTAALTTVMTLLVWTITGFCHALTLQ